MRVSAAGDVEEYYANDGAEISASSAVVVYQDEILIGTMLTDAYYCH